jgi:hypothetical protein
MHEPNLQNIPRDFEIVIKETKAEAPTSISMRSAFVPGRGKVIHICQNLIFVTTNLCCAEFMIENPNNIWQGAQIMKFLTE